MRSTVNQIMEYSRDLVTRERLDEAEISAMYVLLLSEVEQQIQENKVWLKEIYTDEEELEMIHKRMDKLIKEG